MKVQKRKNISLIASLCLIIKKERNITFWFTYKYINNRKVGEQILVL